MSEQSNSEQSSSEQSIMTNAVPAVQSTTQIVIVNYNAGDWLLKSIQSALKFSDALVTVVDNNSTDQSIAKAQAHISDPRLRWQLNSENVGFAAANNQVITATNADYIVLMNPDCELQDNTIDEILQAFEDHPKMGLASCRILNTDGSVQASCRRRFPTPWTALVRMTQLHRLFPGNPRFANFDYGDDVDTTLGVEFIEAISGAFMVARKTAVTEVGLLDEEYFMHCEDLDWCMRFANSGWQVGFIPNAFVTHAKGVSSQSRPIRVLLTLHKGMDRFFDKFYQQNTSVPLRVLVKVGIAASFVGRSALALVRGLLR